MKKMTIAIAISTTLLLVACGKPNESGQDQTSTDTPSMTEESSSALSEQQANPTDQTGMTGDNQEQTDQAAFEAGGAESENSAETGNTIDSTGGTESTNQ
jgi:major membrane immunogen (membrane-anchored lipoprotein)